MNALARGVDFFDLNFLGTPGVIATGLLHGADGIAVVDPGPSTTIPAIEAGLAARGFGPADVRAILITHIHLDHAGATGVLAARFPHATVYVHERGAAHMIDPSKLVASASRLYGADMERLWGEIRPVPADRVHVLRAGLDGVDAERLRIAGHDVEIAYTPGHAIHHVSYFLPESGIAFVGDTGGICRASGRIVLPATPPPDIDLEAWTASTARILAWHPHTLFLTHFGPQPSPALHFQDFWRRMEEWSRRVQAGLAKPASDAERADEFMAAVMDELVRATNRAEAEAYVSAGRFDFSWAGLARYWRKREAKAAS
ncbi:MAG TPA: MBL fold metallo-hydrolase [Vicinamibacterales bacterium]|nr:MBL fold metallo-hydrolase [Vicinamibacterales bacterium]